MNTKQFTEEEFTNLLSELGICKRKLDSKVEALLILSKELDQCRSERDQFKLMAEQLRERYSALKKRVDGWGPGMHSNPFDPRSYKNDKHQSLAVMLCELKEHNKSLQFEVDDLKQKLHDAQGDIKLLREQIARQRVGTTDEGVNTRHFPAYEREDLVKQLESARQQCQTMGRDLRQVLDEKEELVVERDAYKNKVERLNQELNYVLRGDEKRIVDIDALVMENKYLQERLKQIQEEKGIAMATVSKYKNILERKKSKGVLKLGACRSGGLIISQKQVQQLLQQSECQQLPATHATLADLRSLAVALFESLNDKNLALSHQRKTNKILGTRVAELEKKLKTLEVAGLWNIPGRLPHKDSIKEECEKLLTTNHFFPRQPSFSSETSMLSSDQSDSITEENHSEILEKLSPALPNIAITSPSHSCSESLLQMEDLDLLPTKESEKSRTSTPESISLENSSLDHSEFQNSINGEMITNQQQELLQETDGLTSEFHELLSTALNEITLDTSWNDEGTPLHSPNCTSPLLSET